MDQAFLGFGLGLGMVSLFMGLSLGMARMEDLAQSDRHLFKRDPVRRLIAPSRPPPVRPSAERREGATAERTAEAERPAAA